MPHPSDILIFGAGTIGLSLALELCGRGHRVTVVERGAPFAQASAAAAGMLAVEDPHNPPELHALARFSGSLYPEFLARVEALSGLEVPFQTDTTHQYFANGKVSTLKEHSLDPRQLGPALVKAVAATGVQLLATRASEPVPTSATIRVHATGAWGVQGLPLQPRKGQMLRVRLPSSLGLREVHRSEQVYVVPRFKGPQAGTALIGATVEDAGFNTETDAAAIAHLRALGSALVPALNEDSAPLVEAWAGLRPATPDDLPLLGELTPELHAEGRTFVAAGHFRNGILLTPATAVVMADLIEDQRPKFDLSAFSPTRFADADALETLSAGYG